MGMPKIWKPFLFVLVFANLPDIDFIPGILIREPSVFHRGLMHSLGMGVIISFLAALVIVKFTRPPTQGYSARANHSFYRPTLEVSSGKRRGAKFLNVFLLGLLLYILHVTMDFFTVDDNPSNGIGLPVLWPFTAEKFIASCRPFVNFKFTTGPYMLGNSLFLHNTQVIIRQVLPFSLIAGIVYRKRKKGQIKP